MSFMSSRWGFGPDGFGQGDTFQIHFYHTFLGQASPGFGRCLSFLPKAQAVSLLGRANAQVPPWRILGIRDGQSSSTGALKPALTKVTSTTPPQRTPPPCLLTSTALHCLTQSPTNREGKS